MAPGDLVRAGFYEDCRWNKSQFEDKTAHTVCLELTRLVNIPVALGLQFGNLWQLTLELIGTVSDSKPVCLINNTDQILF